MDKLKPIKLKPLKTDAQLIIEKATAEQNIAKDKIKAWIDQSPTLNIDDFTQKWDTSSDKWAQLLLDLVINTMSASDGVVKINDMLRYALNMPYANIQESQFNTLLTKVFNLKIFHAMLTEIGVSEEYIKIAMERHIARELPTKDNVPKDKPEQRQKINIPAMPTGQSIARQPIRQPRRTMSRDRTEDADYE